MDRNDLVRLLNEATQKRAKAAKEKADLLQKGVDEKRSLSADESTKIEKIDADLDNLRSEINAVQAKIAAFDAEQDAFRADIGNNGETRDDDSLETRDEPTTAEARAQAYFDGDEYRSIFSRYLRAGTQSEAESIRAEVPAEFRTWGYSDANKGAPVVHRGFLKKLVELLYNTTQFTGAMNRQTLGGLKKYVVETGVGAASYRDPGDAYAENDGTIANANIDIHDLGKLVKIHEELLDDSELDLPSYLARKIAQAFNDRMEQQAVTGSDAKGPASLLATAGLNNVASAAAATVTFDDLANLRGAVKVTGRAGAVWLINPATETAFMKLKDAENRPLWVPSYRDGTPGLIWGQPYLLSDYMPTIASTNVAVLYGNVFKYITNYIRRDMSIRVLRELYAANGMVGYRAQMRHDFVNELPSAFSKLTVT